MIISPMLRAVIAEVNSRNKRPTRNPFHNKLQLIATPGNIETPLNEEVQLINSATRLRRLE